MLSAKFLLVLMDELFYYLSVRLKPVPEDSSIQMHLETAAVLKALEEDWNEPTNSESMRLKVYCGDNSGLFEGCAA